MFTEMCTEQQSTVKRIFDCCQEKGIKINSKRNVQEMSRVLDQDDQYQNPTQFKSYKSLSANAQVVEDLLKGLKDDAEAINMIKGTLKPYQTVERDC